MRSVIEETQCASTRGGIVDYLSHHRLIVAKVQLVAYTDLASRFHQNIPQLILRTKFPEQEHFDAGTGLFLIAIEKSREHHRIIVDKQVSLIKIIDDLLK